MNRTYLIKKPPLVYVISVLMLVATAARGLILAFESNNAFRWLIAGLLVLYGLLLFSEVAIMRRFPFYLKAYFLIQAMIVTVMLILPYQIETPGTSETTDFYALLFIPLCVQVIFYFPRPASYYWAAALTATAVAALFYQYGLSDGIKFSVTYILAYAMVGLLAIFYVDAEEAKNELNQANQKLQDYAGKGEMHC